MLINITCQWLMMHSNVNLGPLQMHFVVVFMFVASFNDQWCISIELETSINQFYINDCVGWI
jgi:hypothetical protein